MIGAAVTRTVRFPMPAAACAGLFLGWAIFLSYGLTLMVLPVLAVVVTAGWQHRATLIALAAAALKPVVKRYRGGFRLGRVYWWFDGL